MARTKTDKWGIERPVYAFGEFHTRSINNAIDTLAKRMLCTIPRFEPSQEAIIRLIAPQDDVAILLHARKLMNLDSYDAKHTPYLKLPEQHGVSGVVAFSFPNVDTKTPIMPRSPKFHGGYNQNNQVYDDMIAYAQKRTELAIDFGRVKALFAKLNELCSNAAQMRYVWPAILPLLSMNENTESVRQSVEKFRPTKIAPLPVEVRAACRSTAATITMAGLLPQLENEKALTPDVALDIRLSGKIDEGGFVFEPHALS